MMLLWKVSVSDSWFFTDASKRYWPPMDTLTSRVKSRVSPARMEGKEYSCTPEADTVTSLTSTVLLLVTFTTNFTVPGRVYTVVRSASASTVRVIFWAGSRAWTDRRSVAVSTVAPEASAPVTVNW